MRACVHTLFLQSFSFFFAHLEGIVAYFPPACSLGIHEPTPAGPPGPGHYLSIVTFGALVVQLLAAGALLRDQLSLFGPTDGVFGFLGEGGM